jgi:transketolase
VESAVAWKVAIERRSGPSALLFTRQSVPHQRRSREQMGNIRRGGYVLLEPAGKPDAIVIATGSEVSLAIDAAQRLAACGTAVRVVSMPSLDVFEQQDAEYRESVLPSGVQARVSVEAGVTACWYRYVGPHGRTIGIDRFGESAPAADVFEHFGFTAEKVAQAVQEALVATAPQPEGSAGKPTGALA